MKETLEIISSIVVIIFAVVATCVLIKNHYIKPRKRSKITIEEELRDIRMDFGILNNQMIGALKTIRNLTDRSVHHNKFIEDIKKSKLKFHNTHGNKNAPQKEGSGQEGSSQKTNS